MKKLLKIAAIIVIIGFFILTALVLSNPAPTAPNISNLHTRAAVVIALDHSTDLVTMKDSVGFIWNFYGCEDYAIGDMIAFLLWDCNNTPDTILDDVILEVSYSGFTIRDLQSASLCYNL